MAAADGSAAEWPGLLFTDAFINKIKAAKVLAVGAGGIGCELLKTLVLTGFENIKVIDLDTIETSNLNRQFLFRRAHVGQSKAQVAADVVKSFAPNANIRAYQANIKEQRFGLDFFKSFDLVLNGLDNMDARRHVNRLAMAAKVPLVESGTAGYVGQVSVHLKDTTECYECNPRSSGTQTSYPICTLRNTPDKPIHCVVWAKDLLFPRLFGEVDVSDLDTPAAAAQEAAANGDAGAAAADGSNPGAAAASSADGSGAAAPSDAEAKAEAEAAERASFFKLQNWEAPLAYAERVFERLYCSDIKEVLVMEELWKTRAPPSPLSLQELLADTAAATQAATDSDAASASKALGLPDQEVWSVADNARVFLGSIVKFLVQRQAELGEAVFDKDDDLAVDFVTAASNLRAACYGIPQQKRFDAKGMAGNIIHAIATTNAIVGGLIVVEALKLLAGLPGKCVTSFLRTEPSIVGSRRTGRVHCLISGEAPAGPNLGCMVCSKAAMHLIVNTELMTLQQLVDKVLKQRLAINMPSLLTDGGMSYEEGEGLEEDEVAANQALLPKVLAALPGGGISHGSVVFVQDQSQALSLEVHVSHQAEFDPEQHPNGFILLGKAPEAKQEQQPPAAAAAAAGPSSDQAAAGKKRGREEGSEQQQGVQDAGQATDGQQQQHNQQQAKRQKQQQNGAAEAAAGTQDDPVEVIDSEEDDCIVLD